MSNTTARTFLGLPEKQCLLSKTRPDLFYQLQLWRNDHSWRPENIRASSEPESHTIMPRFSALKTAEGIGTLVFLDDSNTLAEQSQQLKLASLGRLSASIAHEIRNPLGAISHAAQLLEESVQMDNSDKRLIEIIGKHSQRVNTIIENILQLSRRKPVQPQRIELNQWLENFVSEFCETEKTSPDVFSLKPANDNIDIQMDPDHLHQVVWNLCRNGLRHAGSPAQLTLRVSNNDGRLASLDIMDNGKGIPVDTAGQIFEPFFTTESTGTGLGLYLARELCELNKCHLGYIPAETGGSCFRIHFAPSQAKADRPVADTPARSLSLTT